MPASKSNFLGSADKATIRITWDLPLIGELRGRIGRKLAYFGMPGPAIEDVEAWTDELDYVTAVEYLRTGQAGADDLDRHRQLSSRLSAQALNGGVPFQVLRGDIDEIILRGFDRDGTDPQRRSQRSDDFVLFKYDLINLDYCGGIGYPSQASTAPSRRVRALQKLFERQEGEPFALFLTVNVRHLLNSELTSFLTQYRRDLDSSLHPIVDWYAARGDDEAKYKLKAAVPLYILQVAEQARFKVHCLPPISYIGTKSATMVHFAFLLAPTSDEFKAFSPQAPGDLLRQPLLRCAGGQIFIPEAQHVGFDWQHCRDHIDTIAPGLQDALRAQCTTYLTKSAK